MRGVLGESLIYRVICTLCAFFDKLWAESRIVGLLFRASDGSAERESVFSWLFGAIHGFMCALFRVLRLDRALVGSIFMRPFLWCTATLCLAPILPTMAVLGLAAVSVASVLCIFSCDRQLKMPHISTAKYALFFAGVYTVATFTSVTLSGSLKGGVLTVFFVLFSVAYPASVRTKKQLDMLSTLVVLSGSAVAAWGIMQYLLGFSGAASWIDSNMFEDVKLRVYSTLQNPNVLSEYLLLMIPLAAAAMITGKTKRHKAVFAACLALMLLCMVLTFSRGGWLGLLIAGALFVVMLDRRFLFVGILVGLCALPVMPESIVERFTSIGNMADSSTSYRVSIWFGTLAMLKDYWLCGIGPGTVAFNKVYPVYSYEAASAQHSHNLFLQLTCDSGICGLAVFVLVLVSFFRNVGARIISERDRVSSVWQKAVMCSVLGFLVQSMTDNSFYNYRVVLIFWAVIALGSLFSNRSSMEDASE